MNPDMIVALVFALIAIIYLVWVGKILWERNSRWNRVNKALDTHDKTCNKCFGIAYSEKG